MVIKNDYKNAIIRHQPVEFCVTIVERIPILAKKDKNTFESLLDLVFKLMIDIRIKIDESWLKPKEGFKPDDEEENDIVHFGKTCIDRLISSVGEDIMLPLLS